MRRTNWLLVFHWLTALLVTLSFAIAWGRDWVEDLPARAFWLDAHRTIGLTILVLTLARAFMRFRVGTVSKRSELPLSFWLASRATHLMIYLCLIAMPLLGWAQSSAKVRHLQVFGMPLPPLVHHNRDLAEALGWWHEQVGWALVSLIGLHAMAALFHHYVRQDDVLRRMLPRPRRRPQAVVEALEPAEPYDIAA